MSPRVHAAILQGLFDAGHGAVDSSTRSVGGGCIHQAYRLGTEPACFVKVNDASSAEMFTAESTGLEAMAASGTVRVPRPLLHGIVDGESYLVMEHLKLSSGTPEAWHRMGEQLAAMHRCLSPIGKFGWTADNFIGATPQANAWAASWLDFWREQRLGAQLRMAGYRGMTFPGADRLLENMDILFRDHHPEPSLLHGDLWSGNAGFTETGEPVLYDPACYYGDRECDLAFTELFGGFPRAFYEAYDATWPRDPGWRARRDFYNLYHVLNHANLFGGGYISQAREMIQTLNANR